LKLDKTKPAKPAAKPKKQAAAPDPLAAVEAQLNAYAERGVFRSFSRTVFVKGKAEFRFFWLLDLPFHMTFDTRGGVIAFPKLLPGIQPASDLEAELKAFLADCASADRPEHRRLDPARLRIDYVNRGRAATLSVKILDGDWESATRKAVHLVNEVFLNFLNARHPEYMIATFQLPDE